jgi:hypothetical protein
MRTTKVKLCVNCEMRTYIPLRTQKAEILLHMAHNYMCTLMCVCVCVCDSMKRWLHVKILRNSLLTHGASQGLHSPGMRCCITRWLVLEVLWQCRDLVLKKDQEQYISFLHFLAPEDKTTMLSQNIRDQKPSYVVQHPSRTGTSTTRLWKPKNSHFVSPYYKTLQLELNMYYQCTCIRLLTCWDVVQIYNSYITKKMCLHYKGQPVAAVYRNHSCIVRNTENI